MDQRHGRGHRLPGRRGVSLPGCDAGPGSAAGAAVQRLGPVIAARGPARRRPALLRRPIRAAAGQRRIRHERLTQRQVEVDGPRGAARRARRARPRRAGEGPPVGHHPRTPLRHAGLAEPPHRAAVQLDLVDRLVGPGAAQFGRPVGGEHEERHAGLPGLDHRRVKAGRRRARRAGHGHRAAGGPGKAEREKRRGTLVDTHVEPKAATLREAEERHGQGRVAGAGGNYGIGEPAADQLVGERHAERRRRVHRTAQPPGTSPRTLAAAATRSRHGAGSASHCASRRGSAGGRRTGTSPPAAASGEAVTSPASRLIVPSPHAYGSSGSTAASATPAASPTEVSTALDTTTGRPHPSATASAARTPPSGATLRTTMSAAPAARTRSGSSARLTDSSAASGTSTRRRSPAISSSVAHGCSAYSRPNLLSSRSIRVACGTSQLPLASTRILPSGPSASRTASTRAMSSASAWPRSATLTLAVRQPDDAAIWWARCGPTAGTVTLTGTRSRAGAGQPAVADSRALASQRAHSRGPYPANGETSPQPAGPAMSAPSRTVIPRNFAVIGMANARRDPRTASRPRGPARSA